MISQNDQKNLFIIIGKELKTEVACYAFGGTAMMFYGYKDETKDVDILFDTEEERKMFISAIHSIGYRERNLLHIYIPEKLRDMHRPLMYELESSRFDLFVKKIFHTLPSPKMKEDLFAVHRFNNLLVKVIRKEFLVLLKAVTERERDFEDIITIVKKDSSFDWQYFIDEVLWQAEHGNSWALLDVEKMLKELKGYVFIPEKYLKQVYKKK